MREISHNASRKKHAIKMIFYLLQIRVSAHRALESRRMGRMCTRTVSAEVVYGISSSKNIRDSLEKFGIGDGDR
jgi:tRNA threonylcarbamoyladenosine modification (KEOPS) complex Cgi121 subunit